jgi:hypothetical protein
MSPGVNGSSLMPREMAGKAAASALNVAARRLVKAQVARGCGLAARGVAAARREAASGEVSGAARRRDDRSWEDSCCDGDAGENCGTSQGAGPGGRDPGAKPRRRIRRKG